MQARYAGDLGDFGKFALLRALGSKLCIGVIWYLSRGLNEGNNDGVHLNYLQEPDRFRHLDPSLFDALASFHVEFTKERKLRCVTQLEQRKFLENARYFSEEVPIDQTCRGKWLEEILQTDVACSDILFLDPDNGIEGTRCTHKHVALREITFLRRLKKPLIIYHHQTRMKGGARAEAESLKRRMKCCGYRRVELIRLRPYSSRFYIVADHDDGISKSLEEFAKRWGAELAEMYPNQLQMTANSQY